ncbi:Nudix hydrolase 20, chloroplastic [Glycine soja]
MRPRYWIHSEWVCGAFEGLWRCIHFPKDKYNGGLYGDFVSLHPTLKIAEERTSAVGYVVERLGKKIPSIRNELYPMTSSFSSPIFFSLEHAATPYFGIKAYGVHMNGYVEVHGQKHLGVGKRINCYGHSHTKLTVKENLIKECEEEAGIPRSISFKAIPVGAISYLDVDGHRYKRDVEFCYDLKLPKSFLPKNEDGEVDSFKLTSVMQVAEVIHKTFF